MGLEIQDHRISIWVDRPQSPPPLFFFVNQSSISSLFASFNVLAAQRKESCLCREVLIEGKRITCEI